MGNRQHQSIITLGPFSLPVDLAPVSQQTRAGWIIYFHYEQVYKINDTMNPLIIQVHPSENHWSLKLGDTTIGSLKCSNKVTGRLSLIPISWEGIYYRVTVPDYIGSDVVIMEAAVRDDNVNRSSSLFLSPFVIQTRHFCTYLSYVQTSLLRYLVSLPDYYGRDKMVEAWRRSCPRIAPLQFLDNVGIEWTCNDYRYFSPELKQFIITLYMLQRRRNCNCVWNLIPRVLLPSIINHVI